MKVPGWYMPHRHTVPQDGSRQAPTQNDDEVTLPETPAVSQPKKRPVVLAAFIIAFATGIVAIGAAKLSTWFRKEATMVCTDRPETPNAAGMLIYEDCKPAE
jgi:hypothetical protein